VTSNVQTIECDTDLSGRDFLYRLTMLGSATHVLVRADHTRASDDAVLRFVAACDAPLAASASPIDSVLASTVEVSVVELHPALPPVPSIGLPCLEACVLSVAALDSIVLPRPAEGVSWRHALLAVCQRLTDVGWRHVATPGTALSWRPSPIPPGARYAGWSDEVVVEMSGAGNDGLSTHRLWVDTRLRNVRVMIDGYCITDAPHNGTQAIVVNIARSLKRTRPTARISLAVQDGFVAHVSNELEGEGIDVVSRDVIPHLRIRTTSSTGRIRCLTLRTSGG
jgi:hypothetical protein